MQTKLNPRTVYTAAALAVAACAQMLSSGCVADGGGGGGVVYGDGPWIQSDVVVEGGGAGWYGRHDDHAPDHDRGYVHPSAGGRPAESHSAPAASHPAPAAHESGGGGREPDHH
jgi:hypothetical protein